MREILFRGKRIDTGEWVEGSLVTEYYKNHGVVMISPSEDETYKVDPDTVGQYTGLTDKNDKKIFEWDIVKYYSSYCEELKGESSVVCYGNFNCSCCKGVYGWSFGRHEEGDIRNHIDYVVIGNIHDNPELIEADV